MDDVSQVAVSFVEDGAMVTFRWSRELWELFWIILPWELTGINNQTTKGSTVTTNPFSSRVCDDICTVFDWLTEEPTGTKSVVNDYWDTMFMSDLDYFFKIWDVLSSNNFSKSSGLSPWTNLVSIPNLLKETANWL